MLGSSCVFGRRLIGRKLIPWPRLNRAISGRKRPATFPAKIILNRIRPAHPVEFILKFQARPGRPGINSGSERDTLNWGLSKAGGGKNQIF